MPSSSAEPDLIQLFVAPLEKAALTDYMVSGSVAAIEYGEPRATLDIDLVLLLHPSSLVALPDLFTAADYYLPPLDIIQLECARQNRGHFNIIHHASGLKADCYPSRNHPYLPWALQNRKRFEILGTQVWFAPPEYVILWKLEFYREGGGDKHLRDIRGMLMVSAHEIDRSFLDEAADHLKLKDAWSLCSG